jgi:gliding motility-associated-like protein
VSSGLACLNCGVLNPNNSVDQDTTNFSQLNLTVAVVGSHAAQSLIFSEAGGLGDTVTVKLRVPVSLLSVGVLSSIQIASYNGTTFNNDRIDLSSNLIKITILAGGQTALVKFAPQVAFDRVEVRLNAGLAAIFSTVDLFYASKQVEAPILVNKTDPICGGTKATFTVSNVRAGVTYNWYATAVGGSSLHTGSTFTTGNLTTTTTYYVESSRTANSCPNPNRVPATADVTPSPVNPILAAYTSPICAGATVTLTVTNANGATINWYDAPTNGNLLRTGASITVTPVSTITYYAEATNGTCTSAARTPAPIVVNPLPLKPGAQASNSTVCAGGSTTLTVTSPEAGVTYNWYTVATGGSSVFTGATYPVTSVTQDVTYYVEASNTLTGCINNGGRTGVDIKVTPLPVAPTVTADGGPTQCAGSSTTLRVTNAVSGVTYNWYTLATGGTLLQAGGTSYPTGALTADITYYVEAVNALTGCINSGGRTRIDITVTPLPVAPTVTVAGGNTLCSGNSTTLTVTNPATGVTYNWYSAATGGTPLQTGGTSYPTGVLTATTTYYVEAVNSTGGCVSSSRTPVQIDVTPLPVAPTVTVAGGNTLCSGNSTTLTVTNPATGVTYNWYSAATGGTPLQTGGTSYPTGVLTATTTYYVEAVNSTGGCVSSSRTPVQIDVTPLPVAPTVTVAGGNTTCSGNTVTLTVTNPATGVTYNWYSAATGGTPLQTGGTSYPTGVLTATTTYYVEAVNSTGGCVSSSRTPVQIDVTPLPVAPTVTVAGGNTLCSGNSTTLTVTNPATGVTYNWYTVATGGTAAQTGGTSFTSPVLTANTSYYVEAVSSTGTCVSSSRAQVDITVTPQPGTPVPSALTQSVCVGNTATLSVSNPVSGVTYNWYDSATKSNLLFTGSTVTTGPINANTTFYVEASNGSCTSAALASVQVTINNAPTTPALVDNALTACQGGQVTLAISNPQSGYTYNWYSAASGGTPLFTGINFVTPVLTSDAIYYAEAVNATGCSSTARTSATVSVTSGPTAPQVSAQGTSICPGTSTVLTASSTTAGTTINWYANATGGTILGTGNGFATPVLTVGTTYYAEAVSASGCTSPTRTPAVVTIITPLATPVVTVSATTSSSVTFLWDAISGATGYQVSIDNGQNFITPSSGANGLTHLITGLQPGQAVTIVVRAIGTSDCELSANSLAVTGTASNPFGDGIFIPNAFTPNGDGNNDILLAYGTTIKSLIFTVYDQWGELQFRSTNKASGWDGTYKGTKQPVGVYVYYVEATLNDGQVVKKKGTVTLLR